MKRNSKKNFSRVVALALVLGVGANLVAPPKANAAIGLVGLAFNPGAGLVVMAVGGGMVGASLLFGAGIEGAHKIAPGKVNEDDAIFMNFLFWPGLLVLDKKVTAVPPINKQDLLDNGYSAKSADLILSDAQKLNQKLRDSKQVISMGSGETRESIQKGLKEVFPEGSEEFRRYYGQTLLVASQASRDGKLPASVAVDSDKSSSVGQSGAGPSIATGESTSTAAR